jgi:uncharacterized repeat protein (TIGR01451 family)
LSSPTWVLKPCIYTSYKEVLMRSSLFRGLLLAPVFLVLSAMCAFAQGQFVYVNNNTLGPNTVSAFSVGATCALTPLAGSPFPTGGSGDGGIFFSAAQRAAVCAVGSFLYVANQGSNNISVFSINPATGALTTAAGSPFAVPGSGDISIDCTPDGQFLLAASSNNIAVFSRGADGSLTPVLGSPFAAGGLGPDGMRVTPDGRFVVVALLLSQTVGVFSIGAGGALTPVPGSPFPLAALPAGVAINCDSSIVYTGAAQAVDTRVDALSIGTGGALTPIAGSPFTAAGDNSNVVLLNPDGRFLFVSNLISNQITVFGVNADGSLTEIAGSPFSGGGLSEPQQMVTNSAGTCLFVNNIFGTVSVFSIAANGALSPVAGSPFPVGAPDSMAPGIAAYPAASCQVDLAVTKTASVTNAQVGQTVTFTVTITNNGPSTAFNVVAADTLPSNFAFVSCTTSGGTGGNCFGSGTSATATFTSIGPGQTATFTIIALVTAPTPSPATNIVTVSTTSIETNPANNNATAVVNIFDVCLQDDSNPSTQLIWNSTTGNFVFCCNGVVYIGVGTVFNKGSVSTLSANLTTLRVLGKIDRSVRVGSASLQSPPGTTRCTITDRNTANNNCTCGNM